MEFCVTDDALSFDLPVTVRVSGPFLSGKHRVPVSQFGSEYSLVRL